MEKETFKKILLYVTIIALIIGIILYIFEYAIPYKKYEAFKTKAIKKMKTEIITIKNKKHNIKLGKQEYLIYKKYYMEKYIFHHNKKAFYYLKKAANNGYSKAEYQYAKHLISPIYLFYPAYNNKFNVIVPSQVTEYAKSIALIKDSAKQGYKPAIFQMALLYLYGSYPIIYYTIVGKHNKRDSLSLSTYNLIRFHFKNKEKAKKILYKLASEKYIPAMTMVNKLYH